MIAWYDTQIMLQKITLKSSLYFSRNYNHVYGILHTIYYKTYILYYSIINTRIIFPLLKPVNCNCHFISHQYHLQSHLTIIIIIIFVGKLSPSLFSSSYFSSIIIQCTYKLCTSVSCIEHQQWQHFHHYQHKPQHYSKAVYSTVMLSNPVKKVTNNSDFFTLFCSHKLHIK